MPYKLTIELSDRDLRHFRRELKKARDAVRIADDEEILGAAADMVKAMKGTDLPDFVTERLEQLDTLIAMVTDEDWPLDDDERNPVLSGLAYLCDPEDLIPDDIPGIGMLDDAVMIELVFRELRHELEAYQDFRALPRVADQALGGAQAAADVAEDRQATQAADGANASTPAARIVASAPAVSRAGRTEWTARRRRSHYGRVSLADLKSVNGISLSRLPAPGQGTHLHGTVQSRANPSQGGDAKPPVRSQSRIAGLPGECLVMHSQFHFRIVRTPRRVSRAYRPGCIARLAQRPFQHMPARRGRQQQSADHRRNSADRASGGQDIFIPPDRARIRTAIACRSASAICPAGPRFSKSHGNTERATGVRTRSAAYSNIEIRVTDGRN